MLVQFCFFLDDMQAGASSDERLCKRQRALEHAADEIMQKVESANVSVKRTQLFDFYLSPFSR